MIDGRERGAASDVQESERSPGSHLALIMLGLSIGILLMALQLWILTLAFDLFSSGDRTQTAILAGISGLVFLGGVLMLRLLGRGPHVGA